MIYRRVFGVPTMGFRSPFSELERMRHQMDRLMDTFSGETATVRTAGVFPLVNLTEDADKYLVRAELPGIKAGELNIQAERNSISLSGERKIAAEGDNVKYHRREREAGTFSRVIGLPGETVEDRVTLEIPAGVAPGDYLVEVGMYRAADLARCLTLNGDGAPVERVVLGTVRVEP